MLRRVLLAIRPVSPVARLFTVSTALSQRLGAELAVMADPAHPEWDDIVMRAGALVSDTFNCHLLPTPDITAHKVVEYARRHDGIVSVVVGRPASWLSTPENDLWARLECPLVAASDHPALPVEP